MCSSGNIRFWLVIWFLDSFRSISFLCWQWGKKFNVTLELFYVALCCAVCVHCFRRAQMFCFWLKVDSIPSESLSSIKKSETQVACPNYIQGENPKTVLLFVLSLSFHFFYWVSFMIARLWIKFWNDLF